MKKGWSKHYSCKFNYKGLDFTCGCTILRKEDGTPVDIVVFDLKPDDEEVKKAAKKEALRVADEKGF